MKQKPKVIIKYGAVINTNGNTCTISLFAHLNKLQL